MCMWLKQSTAVEVKIGPFVDASDGVTAEDGLTISQADVRLKKNDGDWAQKNETTAAAHEEAGNYRCLLDTTDTNTLGRLELAVAESGALPVWREFMVVPANVWDSFFGTDKLETDVAQFGGTNLTASGGRPEVNTSHVAGTAQTGHDIGGTVGSGTHGNAALKTLIDAVDDLVDTEIAAVKTVVDAILADTGTDGVVIADGGITAAKIADNAIDAASIAAGAITSAKFAAGAIDAASIATDAGNEIADALLNRDMSTGTDSGSATVRTPRQALRVLRNKVGIAAGTMSVKKEDDTTESWTAEVTTTAGDPVSEIDPASS